MFEIIGSFISRFFTMLKGLTGVLVGKVMATAGVSFVTYTQVLPEVTAYLAQRFSGFSGQQLQLLGATGIDIFMIQIISALVVVTGSRAYLAKTSTLPPA